MDVVKKLRDELQIFDQVDLARLQAHSFSGLPLMDYAFFPGGNGLRKGITVVDFPQIRTLVLGSDFGCSSKYVDELNRLLNKKRDERDGPTWTPMLTQLRQTPINPDECFFTNAWPVLHLPCENLRESNDNPPIDLWRRDDEFTQLCIRFFRFTLQVVRPDLIAALGKGPALFLGDVWPVQLRAWRFLGNHNLVDVNWKKLDRMNIAETSFDGHRVHCVALNHPSKARLNAKHRVPPYQGQEGEVRLLCEAASRAGIN